MGKCPKCGAGEDASDSAFACGTWKGPNGTLKVSGRCLRRQLAAAEAAAKADAEMVRIQPDQWRRLVELIGMERHANINPWPEIDAIIASVEVGK